jgi:hypothetical protein
MNVKRIDIKEFRELGFLQELNRQFLHPLGMALEVVIDEDGNEKLGGILDYRSDDEGMKYSEEVIALERVRQNYRYVAQFQHICGIIRKNKLGYIIQPVK